MVEYTNIQDNSEEIMKCIVNCETDQNIIEDEEKLAQVNVPNEEEYIDEP
jgi:hypothetical protein